MILEYKKMISIIRYIFIVNLTFCLISCLALANNEIIFIKNVEQDDDSHSDNNLEITNREPFVATDEWQTVQPGQAIPRGLHVRLNLQTGEKEAKLLSTEGDNQANGVSFTENQLRNLRSSSDSAEPGDLPREIKKHNNINVSDLRATLQQLKSFAHDDKVDPNMLQELLQHLTDELHQIDQAEMFSKMNGFTVIKPFLNSSGSHIRDQTALTIAAACQSNWEAQQMALDAGILHSLIYTIISEPKTGSSASRLFHALSSMMRGSRTVQNSFIQLAGHKLLEILLVKGDINVQRKVATLLHDLVIESEQSNIDWTAIVEQNGFCHHLGSILQAQTDWDGMDKLLDSFLALRHVCAAQIDESRQHLLDMKRRFESELAEDPVENEFSQTLLDKVDILLVGKPAKTEL